MPALSSPNDVLILFDKVDKAPTIEPQSAIWHFGWHIPDIRGRMEIYKQRPEVKLLPLYTDRKRRSTCSSAATPSSPPAARRDSRKAQIAEAKARGDKPKGGGGFAYMQGPDNAIVEYVGDHPTEDMNHVHMWQEQPFCAQLWYQKHLNAPQMAGRESPATMTEANCKVTRGRDRTWPALEPGGMFRNARAAVTFGDVALAWYVQPGGEAARELARPALRSHRAERHRSRRLGRQAQRRRRHIPRAALKLGDTRAVMIEGPSREALELVEVR